MINKCLLNSHPGEVERGGERWRGGEGWREASVRGRKRGKRKKEGITLLISMTKCLPG